VRGRLTGRQLGITNYQKVTRPRWTPGPPGKAGPKRRAFDVGRRIHAPDLMAAGYSGGLVQGDELDSAALGILASVTALHTGSVRHAPA
jgi:hypothetical protein